MKITVICTGKIKKDYLMKALSDYQNRISNYVKIEIIDIKDEKINKNMSNKEIIEMKENEAERILKLLSDKIHVIALDINGENISSDRFSNYLNEKIQTETEICFIIGGSLGLSPKIMKRANFTMSFSKLTFPNGLFRIILLEQIYRAFKIIKNEPYHK